MVAALGLLIPGAGTLSIFGVGLTTAAGGLTLAGSLVNLGGSFLLSAASQKLFGPRAPDPVRPENLKINSKVSAAARVRHYGVVKVGGNAVFHRAKDGVSYRIVVHGHGEISQVLGYFLNDEPVEIDAARNVTTEQYVLNGAPKVRILSRAGLVPSAHFSELGAVWSAWSAEHRLDGLWCSLLICESVAADKYRAMYPNNEPEISALAQTTRCFDPRTNATAFTENAALCIGDFFASPDGFGRPDLVDVADLVKAANDAGALVALAQGSTEMRYRIGGSYLLNEKPQAVLARMLTACGGRVWLKPSGKVGLTVGVWQDPEFTLRFSDVLEVRDISPGPDMLDRFNVLPARFNSHDLGHIEVDAEAWRDEVRIAADGEELVGEELGLIMVPSHRQARQVMEIATERANPTLSVTVIFKQRAVPAIYEQKPITLDIPELGLVGSFEVKSYSLGMDKGLLQSVTLDLAAISASAFSQNLADQGAVQELPEPDTSNGVPLPQNVTAAAAGVAVTQTSFVAGVAVGWQAPVSAALTPVVRITESGLDAWRDVPVGAGSTNIVISGLVDGSAYDVSVAFATPGGVIGEDVVVSNVVAAAVTAAPAPPTGLTVVDSGGGVALVSFVASVSVGLWKTEIYRDSVLVGLVYSGPSASITFADSSGAGSFDWTARSISVSGGPSTTDAGPVSETIA